MNGPHDRLSGCLARPQRHAIHQQASRQFFLLAGQGDENRGGLVSLAFVFQYHVATHQRELSITLMPTIHDISGQLQCP